MARASQDLRHTAVIGRSEFLLESETVARKLVERKVLFEGHTLKFDVIWGVMPGLTFKDVENGVLALDAEADAAANPVTPELQSA